MTECYYLSNVMGTIDCARVYRWLSEESYWAFGRSRLTQDAAIDVSRNYGVYESGSDEQIAYARAVADGVTSAWLCDVFVSSALRGCGVGKMLVAGVVAELESLGLKRILLSTGDTHGFYAQFGFGALEEPSKMMAKTALWPFRCGHPSKSKYTLTSIEPLWV